MCSGDMRVGSFHFISSITLVGLYMFVSFITFFFHFDSIGSIRPLNLSTETFSSTTFAYIDLNLSSNVRTVDFLCVSFRSETMLSSIEQLHCRTMQAVFERHRTLPSTVAEQKDTSRSRNFGFAVAHAVVDHTTCTEAAHAWTILFRMGTLWRGPRMLILPT